MSRFISPQRRILKETATGAAIFVFFMGGLLAFRPVSAADGILPVCKFNAQLEALKALQSKKTQLDYIEAVKAELKIRKAMLRTAFECALQEAQDLQENVRAVEIEDKEARILREQLVVDLEGTIAFYKKKKVSLDDVGVRASQTLAKEVRDWRATTYAPTVRRSINLILWGRNQHLIKTARARLAQIEAAVHTLSITENEPLDKQFQQAKNSLDETDDLNSKSHNLLLRDNVPSDETLDAIKATLEQLSRTYQGFFDLSETVNKLLPH